MGREKGGAAAQGYCGYVRLDLVPRERRVREA